MRYLIILLALASAPALAEEPAEEPTETTPVELDEEGYLGQKCRLRFSESDAVRTCIAHELMAGNDDIRGRLQRLEELAFRAHQRADRLERENMALKDRVAELEHAREKERERVKRCFEQHRLGSYAALLVCLQPPPHE